MQLVLLNILHSAALAAKWPVADMSVCLSGVYASCETHGEHLRTTENQKVCWVFFLPSLILTFFFPLSFCFQTSQVSHELKNRELNILSRCRFNTLIRPRFRGCLHTQGSLCSAEDSICPAPTIREKECNGKSQNRAIHLLLLS